MSERAQQVLYVVVLVVLLVVLTVAIGELTRNGGPSREAIEIPLYACQASEQQLTPLLADSLRSPIRPYVQAG
ncbi:hypothetical protein [Streptomyces sp. 35G-GA-8]|uniref:hypothetical protein n=1 Tax=Streptomyces sp. 35G-GA-8 TaxID=2939434 RepID=UPI00201E7625|nr:hypothetical protein [Streptomyces sp. 35G-GA-8]MCL7380030.1 hypothetical protein [Streptomyces sp. 35G-GA-8]